MARNRKKPRKPPDDPRVQGEAWRALMRPECEGLPGLVWRRVFMRFRIDLSDARQASALQVFRTCAELMERCGKPAADGDDPGVNVSVQELVAFLDPAVRRVFRRRK